MTDSRARDNSEFREQLLGFNSKVERLEQTRFFRSRPAGISFSSASAKISAVTQVADEGGLPAVELDIEAEVNECTLHHFDRDDIEAAVLTYRMLTQKNDRLSLLSVSDGYSLAHPWFQGAIQSTRNQTQELLAADSPMMMKGGPISRRELLDTVIYGELAHSNKEKSETFKSWTQWPTHEKCLWVAFDHTLRNAVEILRQFRDINAFALMMHFGVPITKEDVFNRLKEKGIFVNDATFEVPDCSS